ncbi:energy transducer TonB [Acidobacteriota bacterium]
MSHEFKTPSHFRTALLASCLFHLFLFQLVFPTDSKRPLETPDKTRIILVKWIPEIERRPVLRTQPPLRKKPKLQYYPDPTPDGPEPIVLEARWRKMDDIPEVDKFIIGEPVEPPQDNRGKIYPPGDVDSPVILSRVRPEYCTSARFLGVEGTVILKAVIRSDGSIGDVEVIRRLHPCLDDNAVKALTQWRFSPATLNGRKVSAYMTLTIIYRLGEAR